MLFKHLMMILFLSAAACITAAAELRGGSSQVPMDLGHNRDLAVCTNTARGDAMDRGCTEDLPVCVSSQSRFLFYPSAKGGMCVRCVKTPGRPPRPNGRHDLACPSDRPKCLKADYTEPKMWFAGMICINDKDPCYNSANLPGVLDYKCTSEEPICVKMDGSEPALHRAGDKCQAYCYNSANLPDVDDKCNAEKPMCVKADGTEPTLKGPGVKCIMLQQCKRTWRAGLQMHF